MCLVTVLRTNCNNWQCDGTIKEFLRYFKSTFLMDAVFSLCFFIWIAFVCNFYVHNFVGKIVMTKMFPYFGLLRQDLVLLVCT